MPAAPAAPAFVIEVLGPTHDRGVFDCGVPALNRYLQHQARQERDRKVAVPYVLVPTRKPTGIAGFYTLSATSIKLDAWPDDISRKLPTYPVVPATLLGRLATSLNYRGHGLGERLLVDALHRALINTEIVASFAVIIDTKDDSGAAFYERYGFVRFPDSPLRLFMTMRAIAASFA
jgi:GNAT superfamily N-acetyltransferase